MFCISGPRNTPVPFSRQYAPSLPSVMTSILSGQPGDGPGGMFRICLTGQQKDRTGLNVPQDEVQTGDTSDLSAVSRSLDRVHNRFSYVAAVLKTNDVFSGTFFDFQSADIGCVIFGSIDQDQTTLSETDIRLRGRKQKSVRLSDRQNNSSSRFQDQGQAGRKQSRVSILL